MLLDCSMLRIQLPCPSVFSGRRKAPGCEGLPMKPYLCISNVSAPPETNASTCSPWGSAGCPKTVVKLSVPPLQWSLGPAQSPTGTTQDESRRGHSSKHAWTWRNCQQRRQSWLRRRRSGNVWTTRPCGQPRHCYSLQPCEETAKCGGGSRRLACQRRSWFNFCAVHKSPWRPVPGRGPCWPGALRGPCSSCPGVVLRSLCPS
mmetsp:Transcript_46593/g.96972  ORF Transcript_46593/g.96972 Transcript_46593/m.96972 type:complete len:203 (-) Transcript_46593:136-744(-)